MLHMPGLLATEKASRATMPDQAAGTVPVSWLPCRSMACRLARAPQLAGRSPDTLLFDRSRP